MAHFPAADIAPILASVHLPAARLSTLNFCGSNDPARVTGWLNDLPLLQPETCALKLYHALNEVSALDVGADQKFAILNLLNDTVNRVLPHMAQGYLNKPINLPDSAQKLAALAQAIQKNLSAAYWNCLKQKIEQPEDASALSRNASARLQVCEMARAIFHCIAEQILRHLQLLLPVPKKYWREAHQLYRLLDASLQDYCQLDDELGAARACARLYKRILLLGASNLNQLPQQDISQCYHALGILAERVELIDFDAVSRQHLLLVNTRQEFPPFYKVKLTREDARADLPYLRELNLQGALNLLSNWEEQHRHNSHELRAGREPQTQLPLSPSCIQHLKSAWNHVALRGFERIKRDGNLDVIIGLSDIHYHLAGETPFLVFLNDLKGPNQKDAYQAHFNRRHLAVKHSARSPLNDDPWSEIYHNPHRAGPSTRSVELALTQKMRDEYQQQHLLHSVEFIDSSPSGYALCWRNAVANNLRPGEVIALREPTHHHYSIGVVRWVRQIKEGAHFGVQILSPMATPVALAAVHKTGNTVEFLRALRLPPLSVINQAESLITNAISFRPATKAKLYSGGDDKVETVLLTEQLLHTSVITQFSYKTLAATLESELQII